MADVQLLSRDVHCRLYAATAKSIKVADTQRQLLREGLDLHYSKELHLQGVKLQYLAVFHVSADGSYALLAGPSSQDQEYTKLLLVDLAQSRPPRKQSNPAVASNKATQVHADLFRTRPGLAILQISWHPGSHAHFAVLTTDNCWRLYNVAKLTLPEQTFELKFSSSRPLGFSLDDEDDSPADNRQAVAFTFGCPHAWERFTVFFVCSDGAVFGLCPVAPFQAPVSLAAVQHLLASSQHHHQGMGHATTSAWLSQALPLPDSNHRQSKAANHTTDGTASRDLVTDSMLNVVPHALDDHVPALYGPLQTGVDCAESLTQLANGDEATSILTQRYSDSCSAVTVATAVGEVQSYVLTGEVQPCWACSPPACITQGRHLAATRSEVPVVACRDSMLLLHDRMHLQLAQPTSQALQLRGTPLAPLSRLQLLPDPACHERMFAVHAQGAFAVTLTWLPILATYLAVPDSAAQGMPELSAATLERLWQPSRQGGSGVSAAAVGGSLLGSALVLLDSQSRSHCLCPSRPSSAKQIEDAPSISGNMDADKATGALFGSVLQGPPDSAPPSQPQAPTGTGNPEGQQLLTESIQHLRDNHIVFAHMAHHDLRHNIEQLQGMASNQQEQYNSLQKQLSAVQDTQQSLEQRLQEATQFQGNLMERLELLAQLHWALPHNLTAAEEQLRDADLPQLAAECSALQGQVKALSMQAKTVQEAGISLSQASAVVSPHRSPVPPQQLGKLRRALETQEEGILQCQQDLTLLSAAVV